MPIFRAVRGKGDIMGPPHPSTTFCVIRPVFCYFLVKGGAGFFFGNVIPLLTSSIPTRFTRTCMRQGRSLVTRKGRCGWVCMFLMLLVSFCFRFCGCGCVCGGKCSRRGDMLLWVGGWMDVIALRGVT
jgi:hypothetical protein